MKLFIAEKPELGRAIANGLDGNQSNEDGYIKKGDNIVTWAFGHILGLATPEMYDEKYKKWDINDLPLDIDINNFEYVPLKSSVNQLKIITKLINNNDVDTIVNCGDADEEGQILIDEILQYVKNTKPVQRALISDLTEKGVKKALNNIKSNDDFKGMSERGFARSQADWLVGINLTRAYTKLAQNKGYQGVLSVGRVQTPILGLIVARDKEHESHESSFYYTVQGSFKYENTIIKANLKTDEKITNEDIANETKKCENLPGVLNVKHENKTTKQPLPYNLLDLQAECSSKFGYKPDKTLDITQSLREKHKLITYNRSDCSYLPESLFDEATEILESVKNNLNDFTDFIKQADTTIKSHAFNDDNITAHHGIIPTDNKVNIEDLSKDELNVYTLIAKKFIAQFYPVKEFIHSQVEINVNDYIFTTSSKKTTKQGFEILFKDEAKENEEPQENDNANDLSNIKDDDVLCEEINIKKEKTKPKPYYTMTTLLKDLKSVAKYVVNPDIKKLLLEKDKGKKGENGGIGTPATRSAHIKNLFDRGYIIEDKKKIISTQTARKLIELSPKSLSTPDMTALWFEQQKDIEAGTLSKEDFLKSINKEITEEIERIKLDDKFTNLIKDENSIVCPECKKGILLKKKSFKTKKYFWGCSEYDNGCKAIFFDDKGKPQLEKKEVKVSEHKCPDCEDGYLIRRKAAKKVKGKTVYWWGCSSYSKGCKSTFFDNKGKPNLKKDKK